MSATPSLYIPAKVILALTFPGVMMHQLCLSLCCKFARVEIQDICYFQFDKPAGYVLYRRHNSFLLALFLVLGPLFLVSLAALLLFVSALLLRGTKPLFFGLLWLGFSVGLHAFPNPFEAHHLWTLTRERFQENMLFILVYPLVLLLHLANFLRMFWFDAGYAMLLLFVAGWLVGVSPLELVM